MFKFIKELGLFLIIGLSITIMICLLNRYLLNEYYKKYSSVLQISGKKI